MRAIFFSLGLEADLVTEGTDDEIANLARNLHSLEGGKLGIGKSS
jgi:hypothetical protein